MTRPAITLPVTGMVEIVLVSVVIGMVEIVLVSVVPHGGGRLY